VLEDSMKRLISVVLMALVAVGAGCHVNAPGLKMHPHGAPPGQVKKFFKCGVCGIKRDFVGTCHGQTTVEVIEY
jgi:hypothetical protein